MAQLADFSLATLETTLTNLRGFNSILTSGGNPRWLAPELMFSEMFGGSGERTRESDLYAFGMMALEVRLHDNFRFLIV